jgi:hypothetical protein
MGTTDPKNPPRIFGNDVSKDNVPMKALKSDPNLYQGQRSVLTPKDVNRLQRAYAILENVATRIPDPITKAQSSDKTHEV